MNLAAFSPTIGFPSAARLPQAAISQEESWGMKGDPGKFNDPEPIFMAAWRLALLSNSNDNAPAGHSNTPDFAVA